MLMLLTARRKNNLLACGAQRKILSNKHLHLRVTYTMTAASY